MMVDTGTKTMIILGLANWPANRVSYNNRGFFVSRNLTVSVSTETAKDQHELRFVAITSLRATLAVSVFIYSFIFERPANLMNASLTLHSFIVTTISELSQLTPISFSVEYCGSGTVYATVKSGDRLADIDLTDGGILVRPFCEVHGQEDPVPVDFGPFSPHVAAAFLATVLASS